MFNALHTISKITIVIPIIVIALALVYKLSQSPEITYKQNRTYPTPVIPTLRPLNQAADATSSAQIQLDLQGPYSCKYTSPDKENYILAIENKKVAFSLQSAAGSADFWLSGDCLYARDNAARFGKKTCGLSQVISMIELASKFGGGFPADSITDFLKMGQQVGGRESVKITEDSMQKLLATCKKTEVDDKVFVPPANVTFVEPTNTPNAGVGSVGSGQSSEVDLQKLLEQFGQTK